MEVKMQHTQNPEETGTQNLTQQLSHVIKPLTSPGNCPHCGCETEHVEIAMNRIRVEFDKPCKDCEIKIRKEKEEQERAQAERAQASARKLRIEGLLEQSKLGPRFLKSTFESWEERNELSEQYEQALKYVAVWPPRKGDGLLFIGSTGTGKSHLAAAIVNELVKQEVACVFQSVPELLAKLRATYDREKQGPTEAEIMNACLEADLVVLDDLGAERWTAWAEERLYMLIDQRYRAEKPVVITSNRTAKELEQAIGSRTMDRLLEICRVVRFTGSSFRRQRFGIVARDGKFELTPDFLSN